MTWRDLYSYWQSLQSDGRPPRRADLDPPLQPVRFRRDRPAVAVSGQNNEITMILGGLFYETSRIRELSADWTPGTLTELSLADMLGAQP
jgi:hypothetical protein